MKHNDWTDKLRSRMAERKAPVPDDLWNRIEAQLDEAQADNAMPAPPMASGAPRRPRVVRMVAWALSAAAAVAVLVVVGLRLNKDNIRKVASIEHEAAQHKYHTTLPTNSDEPLVAQTTPESWIGKASGGEKPVYGAKAAGAAMTLATAESDSVVVLTRCETPKDDLEQIAPTASTTQGSHQAKKAKKGGMYQMESVGYTPGAKSHGRWSVAVHADGVAIGSQSSQHPMLSVASNGMSYASSTGGEPMADYSDPTALKAYSPLMTEYSEKKHHARPVSVGLTMDVPLTQRVSLVTGVVYTSAATDFISSVGNNEVMEKQKLHYIGIPLNVKVGVWSIGGLHTYVSGGAQADFNVAARLSSGGIDKDIKKDRPQFSIGAAAGVQYNIVNGLGMYAEPGMKYYIDNKSGLETIFKDKQFNFSLQLGLRYGF